MQIPIPRRKLNNKLTGFFVFLMPICFLPSLLSSKKGNIHMKMKMREVKL